MVLERHIVQAGFLQIERVGILFNDSCLNTINFFLSYLCINNWYYCAEKGLHDGVYPSPAAMIKPAFSAMR